MIPVYKPSFFEPIIVQKEASSFNWLGRGAESFFCSKPVTYYKIADKNICPEPILLPTARQVKLYSIIEKIILTVLTAGLLPLIFLIVKCAYRFKSNFQVIADPSEHKRIATLELLQKADVSGDLSTAKVIFLGDDHVNPNHKHIRSEIFDYIQQFYPVKDRKPVAFLLEAAQSLVPLSPLTLSRKIDIDPTLYEKKGQIIISGWEEMAKYHQEIAILKEMQPLQIEMNNLIAEAKASASGEFSPAQSDKCNSIFAQLNELMKKIKEKSKERSDAMISACQVTSRLSSRIFVIAGSNHLRNDEGFDLLSYLKQKGAPFECAVIIPKKIILASEAELNREREAAHRHIEKLVTQ